ncbi:MAG: glycoside hydrolase family 38 C-terminal domain-containing protein [Candidatus Latescibacterota bacterium]
MTGYLAEYTRITQGLASGIQRHAARLERLGAELEFAHQLCAMHPEQAAVWQERIVAAGRLVMEGLGQGSADAEALTARAEEALEPVGQAAKEYTLLCVSHAHIDMNWMWSWPETVAVVNDTFTTMLALLGEFDAFVFSQSQASVYRLIEEHNPAVFEQIRQRVREGRWEVTASQWVEGDKNLSSGESLTRHLLYAREYFQDRFGLSPEGVTVDFEPDTFGHPATLPTILVQGGVRHYYHCRGSRGPHLYWWVGPDGSRLLVHNGSPWYMAMAEGRIAVTPKIALGLGDYARATGLRHMPVLYGVGDHGGGPTRRDLNLLAEMDRWPVYPHVQCARLRDFFQIAEAQARDLPEVHGERNFVFTGCYTSQARQKWANRHGESLLYAAEAAAALGARLAGVAYPQERLRQAWLRILFSQFHDILPGSGVRETRQYALGTAQESQAAAGMARTNALRAVAARVDTRRLRAGFHHDAERQACDEAEGGASQGAGVGCGSGTGGESACGAGHASDRAYLVFNPLAHDRTEVVEARLWDTSLDLSQLVATTDQGEPVRVQVLEQGNYWGHPFVSVAFPVQVPGLGYRAVCLSDRLAELGLGRHEIPEYWAGTGGSWRTVEPAPPVLENEVIRVELDPPSGGILSLRDKRSGREWVPESERTGVFQHLLEQNQGMTAWVIGPFLKVETLLDGGTLRQVHAGPHLHTYRWSRAVGERSRLELDISVRAGSPRVEYRLRVDWREMGDAQRGIPHLRVRFALALKRPEARYEIPSGSLVRSLCQGEEVPAQRWADLAEKDGQGVLLTNTSKHGHALDGTTLSLTLLRASIDPDPLPDLGEHVIEYSLMPHGKGWQVGDSMAAGEEHNLPVTVTSCDFQPGSLPVSLSLLRCRSRNVRLVALKQSQDGRDLIVRLVEVEGRRTMAEVEVAPELLGPGAAATEVDALERPLERHGARLEGGVLRVEVSAGGIASVRLG